MRQTRVGLGALAGMALIVAATSAGIGPVASGNAEAEAAADRILVRFEERIPDDAEAVARALGGTIALRGPALPWIAIELKHDKDQTAAIAEAQLRSDVRFAERDGTASILFVPNDPLYPDQWGYPAILAEQAWDITLGSHDVNVAVLDTGIEITHPDLAANACGPFTSFVPGEPTIADGHGHGTHVSGTVAAVTNNGLGVAGTSQSCLMGAKVLASSGFGQWSWVAAGIEWAANNGADIISMSLGGGNAPDIVHDAVKYAYDDRGVLVVAAAGNSGCPALGLVPPVGDGTMIVPARYDEALAVAALAPPVGVAAASFSSCGLDMEIAAPGQAILSTWKNGGYFSISGTSMATPHVSGVAALVKTQNPTISAVSLRCLLDLTAEDLYTPGRDHRTGWGRVSPTLALAADEALSAANAHATFEAACIAGAPAIME